MGPTKRPTIFWAACEFQRLQVDCRGQDVAVVLSFQRMAIQLEYCEVSKMIIRSPIVSIVMGFLTSQAMADVTVCAGDDCTVVSGGSVRQMSPDEIRQYRRERVRSKLNEVDCTLTTSASDCQIAKERLLQLFASQ
jgi:hypothetical protein